METSAVEAQQYNVRKVLLISQDDAERISDYRFSEKVRTESEAIRQIIRHGLEAFEAEGRKGGGDSREA